jgi:hypothetical protein
MSQNILPTIDRSGEAIKIVAGWDRPLQQLFCTVSVPGVEPWDLDDDPWLDINDRSLSGEFRSVADIRSALEEKGVSLPPTFYEKVEDDRAQDAGNVFRIFSADGSFVERGPGSRP